MQVMLFIVDELWDYAKLVVYCISWGENQQRNAAWEEVINSRGYTEASLTSFMVNWFIGRLIGVEKLHLSLLHFCLILFLLQVVNYLYEWASEKGAEWTKQFNDCWTWTTISGSTSRRGECNSESGLSTSFLKKS
jgi:hypothetical protein